MHELIENIPLTLGTKLFLVLEPSLKGHQLVSQRNIIKGEG
jgi:hypothetical protein